MKKIFHMAISAMIAAFMMTPSAVAAVSGQPIEYAAYCSARYEKDAQIWAMSVNAIDENLYTNFFIKDNVEPLLVELPQAGTYSTGRGNLTFNYAHINRTELEVDSIVITLAGTTPVGALNADMMMYLTDGTIYHLIAEPTCEGISGTDSLDFPYGVTRVFQSDPGAQMQIVQLLATIENYTYAITFKNTTLATLPGTYGDGDWQELLTAVSYVGYDSKTTYEWPCSVSAVVDETTVHVVMHMWDGVEYTLNFHYAEAHPHAKTLVYNGGEAIELVAGINNDLNHMDSVVVTFSGFEMEYDAVYELYDESRETFYKGWMTARGNQTYVYHRSLDFAPGKKYQLLVEEWGQTDGKSFLYDIVNSEPVPEPTVHALLYNGGEAIELVEYRKPELEVNCANHMDSLVVMLSDFDSVDEVAFSFYDHKFWGSQDRTMTPRGNNVYAVAFPQDFFMSAPADLRYEIRVYVNPYSHSSAKMFTYYIYNDGTAIQLVEKKAAPVKTLRNGRLVISVGDAEYTAEGVQIK